MPKELNPASASGSIAAAPLMMNLILPPSWSSTSLNSLRLISIPNFNKNLENNVINLTYGLSNMEGRDWTIQIDDKDCCSIAAVDIDTVEQFNKVCELMEINFSI